MTYASSTLLHSEGFQTSKSVRDKTNISSKFLCQFKCLQEGAGRKFLLKGRGAFSRKNLAKTCYFRLLILKPKPLLLSSEFILDEEFLSKPSLRLKWFKRDLSDRHGLPRTKVLQNTNIT